MNNEYFTKAYKELFENAVRRAMKKGLSRETAEDIVQALFLEILTKNNKDNLVLLVQKKLFWKLLDWRISNEKYRIEGTRRRVEKVRKQLELWDKLHNGL
jgi:transcriptional regulator CtsR